MMRDWEQIVKDLRDLDTKIEAHLRRHRRLLMLELVFTCFLFLFCVYLVYLLKGVTIG